MHAPQSKYCNTSNIVGDNYSEKITITSCIREKLFNYCERLFASIVCRKFEIARLRLYQPVPVNCSFEARKYDYRSNP